MSCTLRSLANATRNFPSKKEAGMQQPAQLQNLKALAARVLARAERNKPRNTNATPNNSRCNTTSQTNNTTAAHSIIKEAISDLPVSLEDVISSPLFDAFDIEQISAGNMQMDGLKMYVASWLIAGRHIPFILHQDWCDRLAKA